MPNTGKTEGPEDWQDLHQVAAKVLVPGVTVGQVTDFYDKWAKEGYDQFLHEAISANTYGALKMLQKAMHNLYPSNRNNIVILDVGAGTGISGQMMIDIGFKIMDGLDPSAEMLRVAQEKKRYRKIYNCYLTGDPTDIPANSYDCITMVGVMGHSCLPMSAFKEMTRIVKPGGYIVNCMREAFLEEVPEYKKEWQPLRTKMEREGRWKVVKMDTYPSHFIGMPGLLMIIQVLK